MQPRRGAFALLIAAALVLSGCSGSDDAERPLTPAPSRIADLDVGDMKLVRITFCDLVPDTAIRAALRGTSTDHEDWGNGEEPPFDGAETDVTHEFGCSWTRTGGYAARAWVFARPVTAAFANEVIPTARERKGCEVNRATTFGRPGLTQICRLPGKRSRVRHAGLFGDTWLTCEIAGPRGVAAPRERSDAWCAQVAYALDAAS